MKTITRFIIFGILLLIWPGSAFCKDLGQDQIKGLDEQVQDIKGDVLAIAAELNQLEEKLLFPSHTQFAVFVSLADEEDFRLDSIEITLDGRRVASHIYSFKELEALQNGGVQRLYSGNITGGQHALQVSYKGKKAGGGDLQQEGSFTISKGIGPAFYETVLTKQGISLK